MESKKANKATRSRVQENYKLAGFNWQSALQDKQLWK